MKILQSVLVAFFLLGMSLTAAADAGVKVIALFSDKALLQVGDEQKIVKKGETFEGLRGRIA
jgi:hypothetical protein